MLVHVSQPHTPNIDFIIKGNIPEDLLIDLREKYGKANVIEEDGDYINARDIDWEGEFGDKTTPGDMLKIRRIQFEHWTQKQLAEKLGIPWQHISNMERGIRPISVSMARRLGKVFGCSPELFLTD